MTTTERPAPRTGTGRRRRYLLAAGALVVVALISVLVAARSDPSSIAGHVDTKNLPNKGPAPALQAKGWINSPPLTPAALKGKVVLYDFWTYSCINCVRTIPYVRSWYDRYKADGLVVIGIHSPEFDFEKVHKNVQAAVEKDDIPYPVALDDNMTIWNAFQNQYWPADYVADRNGNLRYTHFGEGDYSDTENVLRTLLGVPTTAARASTVHPEAESDAQTNPETYLDVEHGQIGVQAGVHSYTAPANVPPPNVALGGSWNGEDEKLVTAAPNATLVLGAQAESVNIVLGTSTGRPIDVVVALDGRPVPANLRGADVHADANGQTHITVTMPGMYRVVLAPGVQDHQLTFVAQSAGLEAYDLTFG
ncbi:MAG TPA: redoxin domain-containing protein [Acidimicrobiia bacterium]